MIRRAVEQNLRRIKELQPKTNAFISVYNEEDVLEKAAQADLRTKKLSLDGFTVSIKDNLCTKDMRTTCASKVLENFQPGYDATVVKLLRESGAIMMGKTNMDEFGMGSWSVNTPFGAVRNPSYYDLSAGGSSGGSAASVAAGMVRVALGSDTGGSVRFPAACCGVFGFKPSYGMLSRFGLISYASSLDTVGLFGTSIEDIEKVFKVLSVHDPNDPSSLEDSDRINLRRALYLDDKQLPLKGVRVGLPKEYMIEGMSVDMIEATTNKFKELGAELITVSLPHTKYALPSYYIIASAEAMSNLSRFDGLEFGNRNVSKNSDEVERVKQFRQTHFGEEVRRRISLGSFVLSESEREIFFTQAQRVRRLIADDFQKVFESNVDVLLTPVCVNHKKMVDSIDDSNPTEAYLNDSLTVAPSLAGLPAITIPHSVPVQFIAPYGQDELLLQIANELVSTA